MNLFLSLNKKKILKNLGNYAIYLEKNLFLKIIFYKINFKS